MEDVSSRVATLADCGLGRGLGPASWFRGVNGNQDVAATLLGSADDATGELSFLAAFQVNVGLRETK